MASSLVRAAPLSPFLRTSGSERYLRNQQMTPHFLLGDSAWSLIAQLSLADAKVYMADRRARGFNALLVSIIEHNYATNAPQNANGDTPFTGTTFTTPREAYFAHVDNVLRAAAAFGITVLLDALYLGYDLNDGWGQEVIAASTADMTSWGQFVGNRYKNFKNIIWVVGGDTDPTSVASKVRACANGIRDYDKWHLFTSHNGRPSLGTTPWSGSDTWLNLNNIYCDDKPYLQASSAYSGTLPFFMIEAGYENDTQYGLSVQGLRAQAYWAWLAGACGYIFGNCPLWSLSATPGYCANTSYTDWHSVLNTAGAQDMTRFNNFVNTFAWYVVVPDTAHTTLTSGYGTSGQADYATCARVADGALVLIYMPTNRTMTVDMTKLRGTTTARWFDPTNGTYAADAASPLSNTGTHNFSRAAANSGGANDWVLVLEA